MIVMQDIVNSGDYSFLVDTALPTAGIKKGISHKASARRREIFERESEQTISLLYNHPSVCYYTVFNEGWGQFDADDNYTRLKSLDPSRVFDATSGWFAEKKSDVKSEHIYFKKLNLKPTPSRPLVLSEFGGYSLRIDGHLFGSNNYGYSIFENKESFTEAFLSLYSKEIEPLIEKGICALVYTQVSDVEDETNGLITYDRRCVKLDADKTREQMMRLYKKI